ncbi:glycosyltransferase [Kribbella caucasensis]|uniref:glycosyltransferase n=1 Tax=Kribbella caucasensis TaxID=2512215 RepID=UPI00192DCBF7|nr:glycosyltransferase [Kribbella sp. VKM Ac-2527]
MSDVDEHGQAPAHDVSVVIPVYRGEHSLPALLEEIVPLHEEFVTPGGHQVRVAEVVLVHDHGPDDSARVIRELAAKYDFVHPVWLSRNFGQHAATLAGMASSGGDWILTIDEDGQYDPAFLGAMVDTALAEQATVVYAKPSNPAPHGLLRNLASKMAKTFIESVLGSRGTSVFHSFRLVLGEVGRSVAAYSGAGVYLDIALGWVAGDIATCPVELRGEADRPSGYNLRSLASHFWRMVLTSGTRLLRVVSVIGALTALFGMLVALVLIGNQLFGADLLRGWTSTMVVVLLSTGAILFSLGVVAEYLGVAVNMAMGKPLYLIVSDPEQGPLGRRRETRQ